MNGPRPEALALLGNPTWRDALYGALYIWGIFTLTVGVATATLMVGFGGPNALPLAPLAFIFAVVFAGVVGGVLSLTWGLVTGMLLARLLRRTARWELHATAYFALGALTALLLVTAYAVALVPRLEGASPFAYPFWAIAGGFMAVTGASAAAGWALAWRAAIRRDRSERLVPA